MTDQDLQPADTAPREPALPRDPEQAQRALAAVQELLGARAEVLGELEQIEKSDRAEQRAESDESAPDGAAADRDSLKQREAELLARLRADLADKHPADLAYVLEALPRDERTVVWDLVDPERDGDILVEVSESVRETLLRSMDREEIVAAAETLDTDELAGIADDLPSDVVEEIREHLNDEERAQLRAAMAYPDHSVGSRMDFDFVLIDEAKTIEQALIDLRRFEKLPDQTDQVFVVGADRLFRGVLPLDRLLINQPDARVADLMVSDTLTLRALEEISEAAQAFERYDLVSAPVLDASNRIIGRLTVNEVVDVIREQGQSELLQQAGLRETEDLFASVWSSAKNRWLWLAINLCTAFFASRVIGTFEGTIEKVVALAALMPIVAGIAGNSGNQTMTLVIRSLALGQINDGNARRLMLKELAIAFLNGLVWGGIAGLFAWFLYRDTAQGFMLGAVMMLAMVLNLLLGALIAMLVPLALQRAGRDPALGSSVLLTFSTDSMGFFIFLGLATLFFR